MTDRHPDDGLRPETVPWVTLRDLAARKGVTPDSLRQRVNRGTLKATKVGTTWVVSQSEADRVLGIDTTSP